MMSVSLCIFSLVFIYPDVSWLITDHFCSQSGWALFDVAGKPRGRLFEGQIPMGELGC